MVKGIKQQLKIASRNVSREISGIAKQGFYAAAFSTEGFAGGYLQALHDVVAALNGVPPWHSRYWPSPNQTPDSDAKNGGKSV